MCVTELCNDEIQENDLESKRNKEPNEPENTLVGNRLHIEQGSNIIISQ